MKLNYKLKFKSIHVPAVRVDVNDTFNFQYELPINMFIHPTYGLFPETH